MTFIIKLMTSQTCLFTIDWNRFISFFSCKQLSQCMLNLHLKFGTILSQTYKDMTLYPHMYRNVHGNLLQKTSVYRNGLYISVCNSRNRVSFSLCLAPFLRRQIVLSRKVWYFVVAYMWRRLWSYLHSYLNSPRSCYAISGASVAHYKLQKRRAGHRALMFINYFALLRSLIWFQTALETVMKLQWYSIQLQTREIVYNWELGSTVNVTSKYMTSQ